MAINWKGKELTRKVKKAVAFGINDTVKDAIVYALKHHPGWRYRTGLAEGSITVKEFATATQLRSLWGSIWSSSKTKVAKSTGRAHDTNYVWFLEFHHGSFLRNAADAIYKTLTKRIKKKIK